MKSIASLIVSAALLLGLSSCESSVPKLFNPLVAQQVQPLIEAAVVRAQRGDYRGAAAFFELAAQVSPTSELRLRCLKAATAMRLVEQRPPSLFPQFTLEENAPLSETNSDENTIEEKRIEIVGVRRGLSPPVSRQAQIHDSGISVYGQYPALCDKPG